MTIIHALGPALLRSVRALPDGATVARSCSEGGEALRCCLRDAAPGEPLILFGYEPVLPPSPYRETGAVFAHAVECPGPSTVDQFPAAWRGRRQVLRAYDARGWIHPATRVHDGGDFDAVLADMFADPEVVRVDSRNVAYGCFMLSVTR